MKTFIMIMLTSLTALSLSGQISLTGSDMPAEGRINYVMVDTSSSPDIGIPSPTAQNWNFSTLYSHYPQVASYSPVTPWQAYGPFFPGSNVFTYGPSWLYAGFFGGAPVEVNSQGYMYWRTDSSGFYIVGFRVDYGIGEKNILESPQEMLMATPASLDSSFSNTSGWTASFNNEPFDADTHYISTVSKTLECDAFGSMTTPFGVFNVLRVHENMIKVDSIKGTLGSITFYALESSRDTFNNYYWWANDVGYPVAIVKADADGQILRVEYLSDTVAGHTITGSVFKKNGTTPVEDGHAELIASTLLDELYGVPETVPLTSGGHFQFSNIVDGGDFLVHIRPDTVSYPYDLPTYYGDSVYWQDAIILTVVQDSNIIIKCASDSLNYQLSGMGSLGGTIWENLGGAKDMLTSGGVKVTLEQNPSGAIMRHTFTDEQGRYKFTNLPALDYKIIVDIPACPMDSTYFIYYSGGDSSTQNLDFYYDSSFIYIYNTTGIDEPVAFPETAVVVYPNPFDETAYLYFTSAESGGACEVILYDFAGRVIDRITGEIPYPIKIVKPEGYHGLLIYELWVDGSWATAGKLIAR